MPDWFLQPRQSVYGAVRTGAFTYMLLILTPGFKSLQTASQTVCHQLPAAKTHIHSSEIPLAQSMKANSRTAQPAYTRMTLNCNRPRSWAALSDPDGLFRVRGIGVVLVLVLGDGKYI